MAIFKRKEEIQHEKQATNKGLSTHGGMSAGQARKIRRKGIDPNTGERRNKGAAWTPYGFSMIGSKKAVEGTAIEHTADVKTVAGELLKPIVGTGALVAGGIAAAGGAGGAAAAGGIGAPLASTTGIGATVGTGAGSIAGGIGGMSTATALVGGTAVVGGGAAAAGAFNAPSAVKTGIGAASGGAGSTAGTASSLGQSSAALSSKGKLATSAANLTSNANALSKTTQVGQIARAQVNKALQNPLGTMQNAEAYNQFLGLNKQPTPEERRAVSMSQINPSMAENLNTGSSYFTQAKRGAKVPMYAFGGVAKGPLHKDGGIAMVAKGKKVGELEGGERIFSRKHTTAIEKLAAKGDYNKLGKVVARAVKEQDVRQGNHAKDGAKVKSKGRFKLKDAFTRFKAGIHRMESAGAKNPYTALPERINKETGEKELVSSAAGKYQFLWNSHKKDIKKITGVKSKSQFMRDPEAQEAYMDYWMENTLMPAAKRIKAKLGEKAEGYSDEQLMVLSHFQGPKGAEEFIDKGTIRGEEINVTPEKYLETFDVGISEYDENPEDIRDSIAKYKVESKESFEDRGEEVPLMISGDHEFDEELFTPEEYELPIEREGSALAGTKKRKTFSLRPEENTSKTEELPLMMQKPEKFKLGGAVKDYISQISSMSDKLNISYSDTATFNTVTGIDRAAALIASDVDGIHFTSGYRGEGGSNVKAKGAKKSMHLEKGGARDLRTNNKTPEQVDAMIKHFLSMGFRVIDERTNPNGAHLHIDTKDVPDNKKFLIRDGAGGAAVPAQNPYVDYIKSGDDVESYKKQILGNVSENLGIDMNSFAKVLSSFDTGSNNLESVLDNYNKAVNDATNIEDTESSARSLSRGFGNASKELDAIDSDWEWLQNKNNKNSVFVPESKLFQKYEGKRVSDISSIEIDNKHRDGRHGAKNYLAVQASSFMNESSAIISEAAKKSLLDLKELRDKGVINQKEYVRYSRGISENEGLASASDDRQALLNAIEKGGADLMSKEEIRKRFNSYESQVNPSIYGGEKKGETTQIVTIDEALKSPEPITKEEKATQTALDGKEEVSAWDTALKEADDPTEIAAKRRKEDDEVFDEVEETKEEEPFAIKRINESTPDEELSPGNRVLKSLGGIEGAIGLLKTAASIKDATAKVDDMSKSPAWIEYMSERRAQKDIGLTESAKTLYERETDETFMSDIHAVGRFARSSGGALASLGRAAQNKYRADLRLAQMEDEAKGRNKELFMTGLEKDARYDDSIQSNRIQNQMRNKQAAAQFASQGIRDFQEGRLFQQSYGKGSMHEKMMKANLDKASESAKYLERSRTQMGIEGLSKEGARAALEGTNFEVIENLNNK